MTFFACGRISKKSCWYICTYGKWNLNPKISFILHFDRVNHVWIYQIYYFWAECTVLTISAQTNQEVQWNLDIVTSLCHQFCLLMRGVYYSACSLCYKTIAQFHQKCLLMRDCLLFRRLILPVHCTTTKCPLLNSGLDT